jgi:D-3-phosphoglycerate dehydrogenase / 2-oxoglutarate reductase
MNDVLFIEQRGNSEPWLTDFQLEAQDQISVRLFDHDGPVDPQFQGITVVVDQGGHATRAMIDAGAAAGVSLWQVMGTGLDHTEVEYIVASGIQVANTPGQFSALALAEHALMFILCLAKRLHEAERCCGAGKWHRPVSDEIRGQTLGVVGLGASGQALARCARPLGMLIRGVDSAPLPPKVALDLGIKGPTDLGGLEQLLEESDYVSLHVPLTKDTERMIDASRLSHMKPTAALINVARGGLVDEDAVLAAIRSGRLRAAALDVFREEPIAHNSPLLSEEAIVTTAHVASMTRGTSRRRARACVENALRVLRGDAPHFVVASR